jgi:hypothetical protein
MSYDDQPPSSTERVVSIESTWSWGRPFNYSAPPPNFRVAQKGILQALKPELPLFLGWNGGQPSGLTIGIVARLAVALSRGRTIEQAARDAGISPATLWRWLAAGRAGDSRYAELVETIEAIRREREQRRFNPRARSITEITANLAMIFGTKSERTFKRRAP